MSCNEELAARVRRMLKRRRGCTEKAMFGGIGFLLNGNMCVGIWKSFLIARVGPTYYEEGLNRPHTRVFDLTGRIMKGWIMVDAEGLADDAELREWVHIAAGFAGSLPGK